MLTREADALTRICPLMTGNPKVLADAIGCQGPGCMFWRWAEREFQFYEGPASNGPPEHHPGPWEVHKEFQNRDWRTGAQVPWVRWRRGHAPGERKGFCGAAGKPNVSRLNARRPEDGIVDGL